MRFGVLDDDARVGKAGADDLVQCGGSARRLLMLDLGRGSLEIATIVGDVRAEPSRPEPVGDSGV